MDWRRALSSRVAVARSARQRAGCWQRLLSHSCIAGWGARLSAAAVLCARNGTGPPAGAASPARSACACSTASLSCFVEMASYRWPACAGAAAKKCCLESAFGRKRRRSRAQRFGGCVGSGACRALGQASETPSHERGSCAVVEQRRRVRVSALSVAFPRPVGVASAEWPRSLLGSPVREI